MEAWEVQKKIKKLGIKQKFQLRKLKHESDWEISYRVLNGTLTYRGDKKLMYYSINNYQRMRYYSRLKVFKNSNYSIDEEGVSLNYITRISITIKDYEIDCTCDSISVFSPYGNVRLKLNSYGLHDYSFTIDDKHYSGMNMIEDDFSEEELFQLSTISPLIYEITEMQQLMNKLYKELK
ncbi:TPA: hypothetical protein MYK50_003658 [Klebsiella variicola subsp. variicola]|nr:hypothetical protein [Klebsiella variicola subsp. variicola]